MNNNSVQKRAVIFTRARELGANGLRNRHAEDHMIAVQRRECLNAAERLNAEVIREYAERGGAGTLDNRPVLQLMLDELRALHDADYVIVTSLDRITRMSRRDGARLALELEADGAELVTANDVLAGHGAMRLNMKEVLSHDHE